MYDMRLLVLSSKQEIQLTPDRKLVLVVHVPPRRTVQATRAGQSQRKMYSPWLSDEGFVLGRSLSLRHRSLTLASQAERSLAPRLPLGSTAELTHVLGDLQIMIPNPCAGFSPAVRKSLTALVMLSLNLPSFLQVILSCSSAR
eukprot:gnl/TRDRNA2_/TRDRNA2_174307_c0_seq2.p1 gnl/TRDRNA2_/TRDRNA2_174307_c0~~gnl/TRDRNA2_/TRDRNA2_174307_c0_seq2.p1  ORF type:complete len:143 (-),score=10.07 gnl/TRDRNA2_/TRDRNA2_174307_c0_seq2:716-1144(-)